MTPRDSDGARLRMTGPQRREQLLEVGRKLFADKGFEGTSVEEIAARAEVSKPVVYEHFGGKEGLYAVVVDREVRQLLAMVQGALTAGGPRRGVQARGLRALRRQGGHLRGRRRPGGEVTPHDDAHVAHRRAAA